MSALTALLHTDDDALRLGRCLETLYPCDQILIVDHNSRDATVDIARQYGARIVQATSGGTPDHYARSAAPGWILALDPRESLTESLAASLFELKSGWNQSPSKPSARSAYSVFLREETAEGWIALPAAQTRLVPHDWSHWSGKFPVPHPSAVTLEGELLRFAVP